MDKPFITDVKDVPNLDAMSGEEIVDWLETVELSFELHEQLFPDTTLEEELAVMGMTSEAA